MINFLQNTGLYWRALGGNNIDQISGHCYQYTRVLQKGNSAQYSTILVDLGKFDNHQALGIRNSVAAVPDIRDVLQNKIWGLKALFLTHSHPDHLNGIVHYIRAGYRLPTLYGGRYTRMILDDLYQHYQIGRTKQPPFVEVKAGDAFRCGAFEVKVVSASHTCFDSFGFLIGDGTTMVYHSGDMKVDQTTFFKQPTDLEMLKQYAPQINYVVADFCGIDNDGVAFREADVLKALVKIIKSSRKRKIFLPVYPTHVEMYVLAFLAAKELGKNVVFLGNEDFYDYLDMVRNYGIDFMSLAEDKIKVFVGVPEDISALQNNFVVIGAFNDIGQAFNETEKDSFALITARTYFNPLKGQMNARNISFATLSDYPILQGAGHGFLGDWEIIHRILPNAVYIPTHCPCFVSDGFKSVAEALEFKMLAPTPSNNQWFRLSLEEYEMAHKAPATWLVVNEDGTLTEVWQKATSGMGFLKRTFSRRRTEQKFKMMLCRRKNKCKQ